MNNWLPPLIDLAEHCKNDWSFYLEVVHKKFQKDFIESRLPICGFEVRVVHQPMVDGKEEGFWHIISEDDTTERVPNLRRCERIAWIRALIENSDNNDRIRYWEKEERRSGRNKKRILLALIDFSYLVVLGKYPDYVMLVTAYPVEHPHRRAKLEKQWKEYCNGRSC